MANDAAGSLTPKEHWALDKRIPLALLLGLLVQTAVVAAAWGSMSTKVDHLQAESDRLQAAAAQVAPVREDLAVLKVQVTAVQTQQARIEAKLDQIADR